jgi:hypothetical protein
MYDTANPMEWPLDFEDEEKHDKKPLFELSETRSFIFHPSFRNKYYHLLEENPALAKEFIEALMNYGVEQIPIPKKPLLQALLDAEVITIEKAYTNYIIERRDDNRKKYAEWKKNHPQESKKKQVI